jgi:hypothetical protein
MGYQKCVFPHRAEPTKTIGHGTLDGINETRLIRGANVWFLSPLINGQKFPADGRFSDRKPPAILVRSCSFGAQSGI